MVTRLGRPAALLSGLGLLTGELEMASNFVPKSTVSYTQLLYLPSLVTLVMDVIGGLIVVTGLGRPAAPLSGLGLGLLTGELEMAGNFVPKSIVSYTQLLYLPSLVTLVMDVIGGLTVVTGLGRPAAPLSELGLGLLTGELEMAGNFVSRSTVFYTQ